MKRYSGKEPKNILVVDDEPNIRMVLSAVLETAGYKVKTAEDGFAALAMFQESVPDLLITDLRMPNMSGFELLAVVRQKFPQVPTIAVSGEFAADTERMGSIADAFFQKGNYSPPELQEKIAELLSKRHKRKPKVPREAPLWSPTGSSPLMLTCTNCLRTFPVERGGSESMHDQVKPCIFCGTKLEVKLVAIGIAQK